MDHSQLTELDVTQLHELPLPQDIQRVEINSIEAIREISHGLLEDKAVATLLLRNWMLKHGESSEAWELLGELYVDLDSQQSNESIGLIFECFRRAFEMNPDRFSVVYNLAQYSPPNAAIQLYSRALQLVETCSSPEEACKLREQCLASILELYCTDLRYASEAEVECEKIIGETRNSSNFSINLNTVVYYARRGQVDSAKHHLTRLVEKLKRENDEDDFEYDSEVTLLEERILLLELCTELDMLPEAQIVYDNIISFFGPQLSVFQVMAYYYCGKAMHNEALEMIDQALNEITEQDRNTNDPNLAVLRDDFLKLRSEINAKMASITTGA